MTYEHTVNAFRRILIPFLLATVSVHGQTSDPVSAKQVQQLANQGDDATLVKLIDSEEALWQKTPSIGYFQDMFTIGEILLGGTTNKIYWLGRKVIWKILLKPTPNEYLAPQQFYLWRHIIFFEGAENISSYVVGLSDEEFALVRHDTFLMLMEYARQLHATIIPGYRNKYSGAMNDSAERKRFRQNAIDNQVQSQARNALSLLATDHVNYLAVAYSHQPKNPQELKQLLDVLNVQGADRDRVIRSTQDLGFERHNWRK